MSHRNKYRSWKYILWFTNYLLFQSTWKGKYCCYLAIYIHTWKHSLLQWEKFGHDTDQGHEIIYKHMIQVIVWLKCLMNILVTHINIMWLRQIGRYSVHDNFRYVFLDQYISIANTISMEWVHVRLTDERSSFWVITGPNVCIVHWRVHASLALDGLSYSSLRPNDAYMRR